MMDVIDLDHAGDPAARTEQQPLPDGDYAIVEMLGHRTLVGRVTEVERFGVRMMSIEPAFAGVLLSAVLIGGTSLYAVTLCSGEIAARRQPRNVWDLPPSLRATLPAAVLPSPLDEDVARADAAPGDGIPF